MLRYSYDNCKIHHTISQVENLDRLVTGLTIILGHFVNRCPGLSVYVITNTTLHTTES